MADVAPNHTPGKDVTVHCTGAVIGGRFVKVSANLQSTGHYSCSQSAAAGDEFAVAARDKASGEKVLAFRAGIVPMEVGAVAVVAGALICTDAVGRIVAVGANRPTGRVLQDGAPGAFVPVALMGLS